MTAREPRTDTIGRRRQIVTSNNDSAHAFCSAPALEKKPLFLAFEVQTMEGRVSA